MDVNGGGHAEAGPMVRRRGMAAVAQAVAYPDPSWKTSRNPGYCHVWLDMSRFA